MCDTGSISHCGNPSHSPQSALSLSFPLKSAAPLQPAEFGIQPCPHGLSHLLGFSELAHALRHLTGLVVLVAFFFNSLVVGVPCSLIFWRFWLFIDFIFVVILLWLCEEAKGFYLCLHLGQTISFLLNVLYEYTHIH